MTTASKEHSGLSGLSLIGGGFGMATAETFTAFDPRTGDAVGPDFYSATAEEVERAVELAVLAAKSYSKISPSKKAGFLTAIAENLEASRAEIIERASLETGLPTARFEGELGRTCGQLRMFAEVIREGSWVDARIDRAQPERAPLPKPDIRSMLRPLGPVAVFCASNFPLAFSVAGGDTASAFASGCPVIVIAHTSHPGTAELAGKAIAKAAADQGLDQGVFSLLFAKDYAAGQALVKHPSIKAVGFTGSRKGGKALMDLSASRPEPVPVFAEMSSVNPVFLLPNALKKRAPEIADGLFASFTLGFGQFCTKPGIVVLPENDSSQELIGRVEALSNEADAVPLLNAGIQKAYLSGVETDSEDCVGFGVKPSIRTVSGENFLKDENYSKEIFGPTTLFVLTSSEEEVHKIAAGLEGQLTATIHGTDQELLENRELISLLESKAGRIVFNSFPTGVEVCGAMVHGGPFPATSNSRSTSVGKRAIERFSRLVAFQGFPDDALPDELKDGNPLGIRRIEE